MTRTGPLRYTENLILSLALGALTIIPLAEIVLRRLLHTGISGAPSLVQHLTLIVGMLGAAIAARENRLLSLSTLVDLVKGKLRTPDQVFCGACAAAVSLALCVAGIQFVMAETVAKKILAYGIPVRTIQILLPVGFAIITLRLLFRCSSSWGARIIAALIAAAIISIGAIPSVV